MTTPRPVLHSVYHWLPKTEIWLNHQIKHLPKTEISAHVVCEDTENLDTFDHKPLHNLSDHLIQFQIQRFYRRVGLRHHLPLLTKIIRDNHIPLVHSHFGNKAWLDHKAVQHAGARQVVTFYGHDVNRLPLQEPIWRGRYQELFKFASRILCEGGAMGESLIKLGAPAEKVVVQHLGVEVDKISFQPRMRQADEPLRILMAATFTEKKGLPYGLQAIAKLKNDYNIPVEVTLIGDARAGSNTQMAEKKRILQTIEKDGLSGNVTLLGYQPYQKMMSEAYQHHIFLSPSVTAADGDTEGGAPVSLIDMQASGMPIVSSFHCDIPEVVKDGKSGFLAAEKDVEQITVHLHMLATHPQKWADVGAAGRKHIETEYNAKIQGERLAKIYQEVMAE